MSTKKIIGVIPARLESTRLPKKLLLSIQGKTLLQRTFEQAKTFSCLDELFIATDSSLIAKHAKDLGAQVVITSSLPNSGTERIVEAFQTNEFLSSSSIILNIQGDHPFISEKTIDQIIQSLKEDPKAEVATAAVPFMEQKKLLSSQVVKCVIDSFGYALYFSRSPIPFRSKDDSFALPYLHHLGIYAYKRSFLEKYSSLPPSPLEKAEKLEQLRFLENQIPIKVNIVQDVPLGVDTPEDLKYYKKQLCS